jgi:UDP-N-acetylglucosamine--N-acetylmuramyl-(pentapeptide) pyrophosphoryl-undecaprenol N-acetylglucosamine transferase
MMRVVLAGGGSAGHIEPALALADALREADSSIQVTCLGTQRGLETRLVPLRGYDLELIPAVPLPRSVTPQLLTVPGRLAGAVHATGKILDRVQADVLVGFGGYVATPAYLAAKRHNVPIVVHEANPSAGIANRLGARLTTYVFTGQPDTKLRNSRYLGLPIRRQIADLDRFALGDKARAHFGLRPDLPVLLVFGGSQGAKSLNRALAGAVGAIRAAGVQVLHITGPKNLGESQAADGTLAPGPVAASAASHAVPYVVLPYVDRMDLAYAAADFALCRAGAMTCAELTAVGLPAAYVPLPIGNGEQRLNALPIVQHGGGLLVEDAELTADWIKTSLLPVLTNIDQVAGMSEAAAAMGRKDADRWLAKAVIEIVAAERASRAAAQAGEPAASEPPPPVAPARHQQQAQPGSLFTPSRTRQMPPGGATPRTPRSTSDGRASASDVQPSGETPKAKPPGGQPATGGGRHRHAR